MTRQQNPLHSNCRGTSLVSAAVTVGSAVAACLRRGHVRRRIADAFGMGSAGLRARSGAVVWSGFPYSLVQPTGTQVSASRVTVRLRGILLIPTAVLRCQHMQIRCTSHCSKHNKGRHCTAEKRLLLLAFARHETALGRHRLPLDGELVSDPEFPELLLLLPELELPPEDEDVLGLRGFGARFGTGLRGRRPPEGLRCRAKLLSRSPRSPRAVRARAGLTSRRAPRSSRGSARRSSCRRGGLASRRSSRSLSPRRSPSSCPRRRSVSRSFAGSRS